MPFDVEDQARTGEVLLGWCKENLTPSGNTFVCPICGSGGEGTLASQFFLKGDGWKCFSCHNGGDTLDLIEIVKGIDDRVEQRRTVAEYADTLGMESEEDLAGVSLSPTREWVPDKFDEGDRYGSGRMTERKYIQEAQRDIGHPDALAYLATRGIDEETARSWGLGYDRSRQRIVIPWVGSDFYHIDRDITGVRHKYDKPSAKLVGPQPLWNPDALSSPAFFVVEGAIDALAVQACGQQAIALGGVGSSGLIEAMGRTPGCGVAVLLLDEDDAGRAAQERLSAEMEAAGVSYRTPDQSMGAKDAGEAFERDRDGLAAYLRSECSAVEGERERRREERYAQALRSLRVLDPSDVALGIYALDNARECIPTGITGVDRALGGGLPGRGLVTLGAVSSVGKTTFAVQVADFVSASGRGVLFVTVEQSAEEIVSKSLSRLVSSRARSGGGRMMASAQAIMSASERSRWEREDTEKADALLAACNEYYAMTRAADGRSRLRIMEAVAQPTVADIRAAAGYIADHDGTPPVIIIDYLQLLAPEDGHERDSDKQVIDRNVMVIRQMARDLGTCVLAISSLNRASYGGSISLDSFKESGAIEYGSDVLLGLQPRGLEEDLEDKADQVARREARKAMRDFKASERRKCELVVLKNRNGGLPRYGVPLTYEAVCNRFVGDVG